MVVEIWRHDRRQIEYLLSRHFALISASIDEVGKVGQLMETLCANAVGAL